MTTSSNSFSGGLSMSTKTLLALYVIQKTHNLKSKNGMLVNGSLLALDVIQKAHNFKSKNGMLVNGSLTLYVVSYKSSTS